MKIAIYHPNLHFFGGGEMVSLTLAEALSKKYDVDFIASKYVKTKEINEFYNLDISKINFKFINNWLLNFPYLNSIKSSLFLKLTYNLFNKYDLIIDTCTNGWFDKKIIPRTICYIHFPIFFGKKKGIKSILNSFLIHPEKAFQYDNIICNSNFTKKEILKYNIDYNKISVIYPPVDVENILPNKNKKNIIVSIGRFTKEKKHEIMIDSFKKLNIKGWELHLIGSFKEGNELYDKNYLSMLKKKSINNNVFIHENMPHINVLKFLEKSKIYWHARGYSEKNKSEYENFGISTVEAMAAGCLPIVINLGAQPEIVKNNENGYCWDNPDELIEITKKYINNFPENILINTIKSAQIYSKNKFLLDFISKLK
jgi:glycosyltransferase involved in cell wall biosynthesis